jgi:hypothetical protein
MTTPEKKGIRMVRDCVSTVRKSLEVLPARDLKLQLPGPIGSSRGASCPVIPGLCFPRSDAATFGDLLSALGALEGALNKWLKTGIINPGDLDPTGKISPP